MLKKTISYTDYNGNTRTEDFYFNLNKAELMEMEWNTEGGMDAYINKIVSNQDHGTLIKLFKEIILKSYGEKSLDGKHFVKNEKLSEAFSQTEAFVELYMELASNDKAAAEFINGIIPQDVQAQVANK